MAKSLKTLSAFAKQIGVSPATITYYRRLGFLKDALIFKPGKKRPLVDSVKAKKLIRQYKDPAYSKSGPSPTASETLNRAKNKVEHLKAARAKFQHEIRQGKRVSKVKVTDRAFKAGREMRDGLLNIPARTAAILAAEPDEKKCQKILFAEVNQIIEEFEQKLKQL